jgi:sec-independent protein translocase protein TatA
MTALLAFFGTGPLEIAIVAIVILLVFGKRLPGAMRSLGRSVVEFKKGVKDTDSEEGRIEGDSTKEEKTA